MAGTVRKRVWADRKGGEHTAWVADYFDQHRKRHTRQFPTPKAADDWLLDARLEVKNGTHVPDATSITVAQAVELWLTRRQAQRLERGSRRAYEGYAKQIVPRLGAVKLSRLTRARIENFADALVEELSWGRAKRVLVALVMILNAAQDRGLVGQNVAARVRIDAIERERRPLTVGIDVPSTAEVQALITAAIGRVRPRLLLLIFTGLRASELRALHWRHIDFDRRLVTVQQRADWWGQIGSPKSRNGYRQVPLPPLALNTLRAWRLETPDPSDAGALIFPGKAGRPLHHSSLQESFDRVQRAASVIGPEGKPKYGLHALRHFYASWRIASGAAPKRLQQVFGHGSIRMTYDVYGHWLGDLENEHLRLAEDEAALVSAR